MKESLVSVVMITYGHEQYIAQAIEGVLMQQTNFEVELIIADDCSPDDTQNVVENIIKTHSKSHWVKHTRHQHNKGMNDNFLWAMKQAKGKYIALCEGDDYWTDPLKLQKQVDFLEANEEYSTCFHKVNFIHINPALNSISNKDLIEDRDFFFSDFIDKNPASTCSVMFRTFILKDNTKYLNFQPVIDDFMILLFAKAGKIRYMNDIMGTYNIHPGGVSSMRDPEIGLKLYIGYRKAILKYFESENDPEINKFFMLVGKLYHSLGNIYFGRRQLLKSVPPYLKTFYYVYKGKGNLYREALYPIVIRILHRPINIFKKVKLYFNAS